MAEVWKAFNTLLQRYVAFKLLHTNLQGRSQFHYLIYPRSAGGRCPASLHQRADLRLEIPPLLWRPGPFGLTPSLFRRNLVKLTRRKDSCEPKTYQSGITDGAVNKHTDEGAGAEVGGQGEDTNIL